jgi:hypothetical protein
MSHSFYYGRYLDTIKNCKRRKPCTILDNSTDDTIIFYRMQAVMNAVSIWGLRYNSHRRKYYYLVSN